MKIAQEIIEVFENYLEKKKIEIDNPEREQSGDGACQIYGTEYGEIEEKINQILSGKDCVILSCMGNANATIEIEDGMINVRSEQLNNYLYEYSME